MGPIEQPTEPKLLCVAPMMAWTDRHCRYLHRLFTADALLFTEMVTTGALLHGDQWHLLDFNPAEHPVALQLGGCEPDALAECARRVEQLGYDEINLNVGCPSDRVQKGTFGACLMLQPATVARCVSAMRKACSVPVTVKCRLGVDDADSDELLHQFIATVAAAGCQRFYVHARKAILGGLTPAQNRSIPPLQPDRVRQLKQIFPNLSIVLNGGITTAAEAMDHLHWADGVMIGRAAYHNPGLLSEIEHTLGGTPIGSIEHIFQRYRSYMVTQLDQGVRLHAMTRHLLNLCNGRPGARRFRQLLSNSQRLKQNDITLFDEALAQVYQRAA
ncbi:MAG: tRNA dihydrouridine(20/20a) synthase DusA [Pseudomonadota bacterium]